VAGERLVDRRGAACDEMDATVTRRACKVMRIRCAEVRENVMDVLFVAVVLVFFGLSFGYAAFCDRL
jgi:hypothetical protein